MTPEDLDRRLAVAEDVIREAGELAAGYFRRRASLEIDRKGVQDLVSVADRECEELIVAGLSHAFPEDGLLGEEGARRNADGGATWVIDPIDGTHNFLTGVPFWCLSVGLVAGGESLLGLIYHPAEDELFIAQRGRGAFANGRKMEASGETDITRARVCVGFSYRQPVSAHVRTIEALLSAHCEYCRLGSGALGLAYVAAGRFDGYLERHINSWDVAAGLALVQEAGGRCNDFYADDGLTKGNRVVATAPALYESVARLAGFDDLL